MLVVASQTTDQPSFEPLPVVAEDTPAGLVDVIDEAEEEDDTNNNGPVTTTNGMAEVLPDNSSPSDIITPLEHSDSQNKEAMSQQNNENNNNNNDETEQTQASLSTWLIPELAKVAETLQLLRSRLPSSAVPQSWQLEDAICNALEATRRVADQYIINAEDSTYTVASPSDNSLIDVMMGEANPNSEYQTLSRYASNHHKQSSSSTDQPDYQKLAIMNGLAPPDESNYEASMITTLSDEDEYDRLAYEFPIHPSLRKRVPRQHPIEDDEGAGKRSLISQLAPRVKLTDASVGRCDGSVFTNDKACNTYRVLNVSRPVQAVELPPAKFSKHVQTHVLVTDKCVGDDDDDLELRRNDVEVQTEDVDIKLRCSTEDSWAQTEDKFTEDVSVYANMLRDFGQSISTQTILDQLPVRYAPSPTPLVVDTAPKLHMTVQVSPRSVTPNSNLVPSISSQPANLRTSTTTRQFSSASSSGGGSLRSPSSTSTPIAATSNGCYQLFVRIDQNGRGSTANLIPQHTQGNRQPLSANNNNNHTRLLSTSSSSEGNSSGAGLTSGSNSGSTSSTAPMGPPLMSDVMMMMNSAILSPLDSGTSNASAFLPSSITSSTMSPPNSDSQGTSSATNDHSLSDDRGSSPRSWQSPIQITGPSEPSPILERPAPPPRLRRASVNPQAAPFRSGQLAAVADKAAFKSLIKISEGSPPEIRQTSTTSITGPTNLNGGKAGQLTQVSGNHYHQNNQGAPKQVTKIIHRLQRDPSIRAWCSVDNLLRYNILTSSRDDLPGVTVVEAQERAISPPALFREFCDLTTSVNDSGVVHEMAVDCDQILENSQVVAHHHLRRHNHLQAVILPPPKTKQLSMNDVSRNDVPVLREPLLNKQSKRVASQQHLPQKPMTANHKSQHESVVCLARRTLVSVGSEDSDYSVMEAPFEKTSNNNNYNRNKRSNYPAAVAALNNRNNNNYEQRKSQQAQHSGSSGSNGANGAGNGNSVLSRLSNFLHFGNSKQKRPLPITSC